MSETVVIVGAGPAGLMLACELGLAGVSTVVLDRLPRTSDQLPGQGLNTTAVELLDQRGLLDDLREQAVELQGTHFSLFWLNMQPLAGRNTAGMLLGQEKLEQHLEQRALSYGVQIRRGHEFVSFEPTYDGVEVRIAGPDGEYTFDAAYLVGADGERSQVREQARIGFTGAGQPCYGLAGDVEAELESLDKVHVGARFSPAGGLYSSSPAGPGLVRVVTAEFGVELPPEDQPADLAELQASVLRLNGVEFPATGVRWLKRYGGPTRTADSYRAGRVFLIGDAAHTFFPLAGLRLNTCLHDAVNLGWKLAADLQGWAPADLLDSYDSERRPVGVRTGAVTDAQLALVHPAAKVAPLRELFGDLLKYADVNRYLLDLVTGLEVCYPMGPATESHPLLGKRLPHVPLHTTAGVTSVPALLRSGRGVLIEFSQQPSTDSGPWHHRLDLVGALPVPEIDAAAVLVRPDGHVAWVQPTGAPLDREALSGACKQWFGEAS